MKIFYFLLFSLLLLGTKSYAQYAETFDVPNKGILAGPCANNNPTSCTSNDFAGVNWTLEGNLSVFANTDYFKTTGGKLEALDIDEEICWLSPVLNMTGTASFSLDLTWLQFDDYDMSAVGSKDYIDVSYRLDGGSWVTLPNLIGGGPRTISYLGMGVNIDGSSTIVRTGLTGSTLQIRVCVDVNSNQEIVTIDNVSATNATTGSVGPVCDLNLVSVATVNEDCPGAADGSITVNATTSNGPITYTISGPVSSSNQTGVFMNLPPGNYSISLQDGSFAPGNCTADATRSIAPGVDSSPPTGQVNPITVNCPADVPAPDISVVFNVDDNCQIPCVTEPWINEFHYDNIGTDVNEFIEVAGPAGIDLSNYTLYVYDGFNGEFYNTFNLSGIIPDQDNGFGAAFVLTPNLQNMTEGIALVKNGTEVIEFISYEGVVTATNGPAMGMTSVDVGVSESNTTTPEDGSLGRVGNGNKPSDFTWAVLTQTQANLNTGQTITDCPDNEPTVTHFSDTNNGGSGSNADPYIVTRTYRVTDAYNNFTNITQTITANNCCTAPTVSVAAATSPICPGETASFELTGTPNASVTYNINMGGSQMLTLAADGMATVEVPDAASSQTLTLVSVDLSGCLQSLTESATVVVEDNEDPVIFCQNINADLDASGLVTIMPSDVFDSGSDNCGMVNLVSVVPSEFDCSNIGIQTVTLTANDGNGNTASCIAEVNVRDLSPPVFECQDITVSLDASGTFVIPSANFIRNNIQTNYEDNCASSSPSFGITSNSWDCDDLGPNTTTIFARDGNGNETSCTITVTITDDLGVCAFPLSGTIRWEHNNNGVPAVNVGLTGDAADTAPTNNNGEYTLAVSDGSYTLTPSKNDDLLNGLSVLDVLLIQRHITFVERLTDPYKLIAADVNESGSISALDAAIVFQSVLGNPMAQAVFGRSWRFVDATHTFLIPESPWTFPETISLNNVTSATSGLDFIGIKKGDIDGSWSSPMNLSSRLTQLFVEEQMLETAQSVQVAIRAKSDDDLSGWQFALQFDTGYLSLQSIVPAPNSPMKLSDFNTQQAKTGLIRSAFTSPKAISLNAAESLFFLNFEVRKGGLPLSKVLQLNNQALPGKAYNEALQESDVQINFQPRNARTSRE